MEEEEEEEEEESQTGSGLREESRDFLKRSETGKGTFSERWQRDFRRSRHPLSRALHRMVKLEELKKCSGRQITFTAAASLRSSMLQRLPAMRKLSNRLIGLSYGWKMSLSPC